MVRLRGCAMRAMIWAALLLAGPAAWGQAAQSAPGDPWPAMPQTTVKGAAPDGFAGAQPAAALPKSAWLQQRFAEQAQLARPMGQGPVLAKSDPFAVITPLAQLTPRAIPIPTQWPQAKVEAIPTQWPNLKLTPIGGAEALGHAAAAPRGK